MNALFTNYFIQSVETDSSPNGETKEYIPAT